MEPSWKQLDLAGGGLQSANLRLARVLKRRSVAYFLWLLFPLGLHRAYLDDRRGAVIYCLGSGIAVAGLVAGPEIAGWIVGALVVARALVDLAWIEKTIVSINKRLRVEIYMNQTPGAPAGYKGRFRSDDDMSGTAPHESRAPSFAEQERQLRNARANAARERQ